MFNLHDFVLSTLQGMSTVYPQWQVKQIALGYYSKGWILDEDLAEIESWYVFTDNTVSEEEESD